jgi:kynurenine formamidase
MLQLVEEKKVKVYDLSQPLGIHTPFWPYYPPFEMKYFKRKPEHGVNAQYIQTSLHIGTHLDAPRHFITRGKTIDQIPLDWLFGPGVIVDLSKELDDFDLYTPQMIEEKVDVHEGDIVVLHTGWSRYAWCGPEPDEERYIHRHPGAHPDMVDWLLKKKVKLWGVDAVSTDHPMDLPIGRFLGKGTFGHCDRVRAACEKKFGKEKLKELFPDEDYQLTHNKLFGNNCIHMENLGGEISKPELQNKRLTIGCFPFLLEGGEAAFARVVAFLEVR